MGVAPFASPFDANGLWPAVRLERSVDRLLEGEARATRVLTVLLTLTYLALTFFTALVFTVVPAWLVAVTVQV